MYSKTICKLCKNKDVPDCNCVEEKPGKVPILTKYDPIDPKDAIDTTGKKD